MQRNSGGEPHRAASAPAAPQPSHLSDVDFSDIDQKQMELRGAVEHRIATLERTLMAKDQQVVALQTQLRKLEEDYQYNYQLIVERDRAIEEAAGYVVRLDSQLKQATEDANRSRKLHSEALEQSARLQEQLRQQTSAAEAKMIDVRRQVEVLQSKHQQQLAEKDAELIRVKDEMHATYLKRVADDEKARSAGIASLESARREMEDAFKVREANLVSELTQWREKCDTLRDELALARQELCASSLHSQTSQSDKSKVERDLDELRVSFRRLEESSATSKAQLEARAKSLDERVSSLIAENQRLVAVAHDATATAQQLQQRLDFFDSSSEGQAAKFQEAAESMRNAHAESLRSLEAAMRSLEQRCSRLQGEVATREQEVSDANSTAEKRGMELLLAKETIQDLQHQLRRSSAEAERARRELSQSSERCTELELEVQQLQQKLVELQRSQAQKLETALSESEASRQEVSRKLASAQSEASRLTRELHASDAAREALESQLRLLQDDRGLQRAYEKLLAEKRELEERNIQLQKMNEAIRSQVDTFTAELQNDPVVRNARQSAAQAAELQQRVSQLQGAVDERDEQLRLLGVEIRRYQDEILGHQGSMASFKQLSADHARLRGELDEVRRAKTIALATHHEDDHGGQSHTLDALNEAEFWRQRAKQLEAALAQAVQERDAARKRLQEAVDTQQALSAEKRSVTEVNNLLKAQLKQAYMDASSVAEAKAIAAPVLATVPPNTLSLTVEKVATEHQAKLTVLEEAMASLKKEIAHRRAPLFAKPTTSSELRRGSMSLQRSHPSSGRSDSGGSQPRGAAHDTNAALQVRGSADVAVRHKGSAAVRHYGISQV